MAFLAFPPERSLVHVIPVVAGIAAGRCDDLLDIGYLMARVTSHGTMRTQQWVACLLVVIEDPSFPTIGVVADSAANNTESTRVIRILMAAYACAGCILERSRSMAFFARYCRVQSDQRKSRQVMVEGDLLSPARFLVALLAIATELALVRVILAMTGDARH